MTSHQDHYEPETGLLSAEGLTHALESELSRAARHEVPLSLVYMELSSLPSLNGQGTSSRLVAAKVAEALLGTVRAEDRVARIGDLRFAVLAVEAGDGQALGQRLVTQVEKHVQTLGAQTRELTVTVTVVDCHFDEMSRAELLEQAERQLAVAILQSQGIPYPPTSPAESPPGS
jgi:diguanylate cyclase (GGDEF)-like protein